MQAPAELVALGAVPRHVMTGVIHRRGCGALIRRRRDATASQHRDKQTNENDSDSNDWHVMHPLNRTVVFDFML